MEEEILLRIHDSDAQVRFTVARELGGIKSADAVPALVELLADDEKSVRLEAAISLAKLQKEDGAPELVEGIVAYTPIPSMESFHWLSKIISQSKNPEKLKEIKNLLVAAFPSTPSNVSPHGWTEPKDMVLQLVGLSEIRIELMSGSRSMPTPKNLGKEFSIRKIRNG